MNETERNQLLETKNDAITALSNALAAHAAAPNDKTYAALGERISDLRNARDAHEKN